MHARNGVVSTGHKGSGLVVNVVEESRVSVVKNLLNRIKL